MKSARLVAIGIIVAAMGAVMVEHSPIGGFIQIIMGAMLAALGIYQSQRKKSEAV